MLHNKRRKSKGEKPQSNQLVLRFLLQEMMHPCHLRFTSQMTRKTASFVPLISFLADECGNVEIVDAWICHHWSWQVIRRTSDKTSRGNWHRRSRRC